MSGRAAVPVEVDAVPVEVDAVLVEEAVLRASEAAGPQDRIRFRAERDAIYSMQDAERRDAGFRELHSRWFESMRLDEPLRRILSEWMPATGRPRRPARCVVVRAAGAAQEGADLHDTPSGPVLAVRLRAATLLDMESAVPLLRRELLHVADMLDPEFGYCRELPGDVRSAARDRIMRDRYRVLWDVSVDGRLAARGLLSQESLAQRRREIGSIFPALDGAQLDELFFRLWRGPRPGHDDLCALARGPAAEAAPHCPLCGFATSDLQDGAQRLNEPVIRAIQADHPGWSAGDGLCVQCADLHAARL